MGLTLPCAASGRELAVPSSLSGLTKTPKLGVHESLGTPLTLKPEQKTLVLICRETPSTVTGAAAKRLPCLAVRRLAEPGENQGQHPWDQCYPFPFATPTSTYS